VPRVPARVAATTGGWWSRRISRPRASCPFQDNAIVLEYANTGTRAPPRPPARVRPARSWQPLSFVRGIVDLSAGPRNCPRNCPRESIASLNVAEPRSPCRSRGDRSDSRRFARSIEKLLRSIHRRSALRLEPNDSSAGATASSRARNLRLHTWRSLAPAPVQAGSRVEPRARRSLSLYFILLCWT